MTEAIIVALITAGAAVLSQIVISARSTKDLFAKLNEQSQLADAEIKGEIAVIKTEISDLRQEVAKHNGVIERTYKLEQASAVHEEKIKNLENQIKG